ncbi:suppressor of cytokine signaling 2-like [Acanthaster planci]|uniref:Suppressor of cytokine signaling 2-like n=1 Tax=Acanthaster planci TaxID=133434 RepID=A0A8B7ZE90_ACAPL|nr:suppressor of cytokine signaling 2-like [Acanthaster planci]
MCGGIRSPVCVNRVLCDKPGCAARAPMPPGTMSHHHYQNSLVSTCSGTTRTPRSTADDLERLRLAVNTLHTSGWYHGAMTFVEAKRKLKHCDVGTFLVRDSSKPNYLYSLSVKTPMGTTSVRIEYEYGKFTLDSEEELRRCAPSFDCVVKLLHYYMPRMGQKDEKEQLQKSIEDGNQKNNTAGQLVWREPSGRRAIAAQIIKPLRSQVPSLQHLCRVSLNRYVEPRHQADLPLPGKLKGYLKQYPFDQ